jgi:hypothetical protein
VILTLSNYYKEVFILAKTYKFIINYYNIYKVLINIIKLINIYIPINNKDKNKDIINKVFFNIKVIK